MRRALASAVILWMIALGAAPVRAAQPGLQLSVEPLVVQFAVAPGGQASVPVTIKNVGTQPADVSINQIDWQTTVDGTVRTAKPGALDISSLNPFLRLPTNSFTLAPGETHSATLAVVLPPSFSAKPANYWGGYFVRANATGQGKSSFGVGANILVYETLGKLSRHIKLTSLKVEDAGNGAVKLTARLLNDGGTYVRPQIHMDLAQAGRIVQAHDDSTPAIFAGTPRLYTHAFESLAPGKYLADVTIDYGGDTLIEGSTEFTVR